jgi:hypothetical protein
VSPGWLGMAQAGCQGSRCCMEQLCVRWHGEEAWERCVCCARGVCLGVAGPVCTPPAAPAQCHG